MARTTAKCALMGGARLREVSVSEGSTVGKKLTRLSQALAAWQFVPPQGFHA